MRRARLLTGLSASLCFACLMSVVACREDTGSATAPNAIPRAAVAEVQALSFDQVAVGDFHSCGLTAASRVYCWGRNNWGQLGGSGTADQPSPVPVQGGLQFRRLTASGVHTCGITVSPKRAYCWGNNEQGQLGDGTRGNRSAPVPVSNGLAFSHLDAGAQHTCGLLASGVAYCWGENFSGVIGDGTTTDRLTPAQVSGQHRFRAITAGMSHSCGLTDDDVAYCWGNNANGQLGDGTLTTRLEPVPVAGGLRFRGLSAGSLHTCGVTRSNEAYCWGFNFYGQIGDGRRITRRRPVAVAGGLKFLQVSAGDFHTCGVTPSHSRTHCWGSNGFGGLGDGSTVPRRLEPAIVAGGLRMVEMAAGSFHTCAIDDSRLAYCWGRNLNGRLGDGTTTDRPTPVPVAGPS